MSCKMIIRSLICIVILLASLTLLCACGLVDPAGCHHILGGVNKRVDLGEMGYCIGTLEYKYCFLCDKTIITEGGIILECEFEIIESDSGEDESGSNYWSEKSKCKNCGLIYETGELEYIEPGCKKTIVRAFRFLTPDEDLILEGNEYSGGESHEFELQYTMLGESCEDGINFYGTCKNCGKESSEAISYHLEWFDKSIDLSALGMCGEGSKFLISTCICGERTYGSINDAVEDNCNWDNVNTVFTDDEGNEHTVREMYCSDCDSSILFDSVKVFSENCEFYYNVDSKIVIKGETVVDGTYRRGGEIKHDYEYTYTLYGESCEDGTNHMTVRCKRCGDSYESMFEGHAHEEKIEYDLTNYGICGDYSGFLVLPCPCGLDNALYAYHSEACDVRDTGAGFYVDEQGREVSFMTQTCLKCNLSITIYEYIVPGENCTATKYKQAVLSSDDNILIDTGLVCQGEMVYHIWEETYTTLGNTCQDGILIESSCKGCDLTNSCTVNDHIRDVKETQFNICLTDYGLCGDLFSRFSYEILICKICNDEEIALCNGFECCWLTDPGHIRNHNIYYEPEEVDGVVHYVMESKCCYCGFSIIEDSYSDGEVKMKKTTILKNDEIVFEYTYIDPDQ